MELPLLLLPTLALPLLLLFLILGIAHLYHLLLYGRFHVSNMLVAAIFLAYTAVILSAAATYLRDVDWGGTMKLSLPLLFPQ